jgi:hypothetical protein
MPTTDIRLVVVPAETELSTLRDYEPHQVGNKFSDQTTLNIQKVQNGYAILYTDHEFCALDTDIFAKNLISIAQRRFPNTEIAFASFYQFREIGTDRVDKFSIQTAQSILDLDEYLKSHKASNFTYHTSYSIGLIESILAAIAEREKEDSDEEEDDDESEYDDFKQPFLDMMQDSHDDEDDVSWLVGKVPYGEKKSKRRKSKQDVSKSAILRHADNGKKNYKRHGVIVIEDKDDLKKDRDTIKEFLKEFIPGDAEWKKDLRRDLLDRWLDDYAITKKRLKKVEKEYRKARSGKKSDSIDRVLTMSQQMVRSQYNHWNDPTK